MTPRFTYINFGALDYAMSFGFFGRSSHVGRQYDDALHPSHLGLY